MSAGIGCTVPVKLSLCTVSARTVQSCHALSTCKRGTARSIFAGEPCGAKLTAPLPGARHSCVPSCAAASAGASCWTPRVRLAALTPCAPQDCRMRASRVLLMVALLVAVLAVAAGDNKSKRAEEKVCATRAPPPAPGSRSAAARRLGRAQGLHAGHADRSGAHRLRGRQRRKRGGQRGRRAAGVRRRERGRKPARRPGPPRAGLPT